MASSNSASLNANVRNLQSVTRVTRNPYGANKRA